MTLLLQVSEDEQAAFDLMTYSDLLIARDALMRVTDIEDPLSAAKLAGTVLAAADEVFAKAIAFRAIAAQWDDDMIAFAHILSPVVSEQLAETVARVRAAILAAGA